MTLWNRQRICSYNLIGVKEPDQLFVSAPSLELVAKWLREEKDIVITPQPFSYNYIEERTDSYILTIWFGDNFEEYSTPYNTYEDAMSIHFIIEQHINEALA